MKQPVTHYTEGRNAWNLGVVGSLIRVRGLAVTATVTLVTMGAPWWWPQSTPSKLEFSLSFFIAAIVLVCGGMFFASLIYLRRRTIRSLNMKYLLHRLTHNARDRQTALHSKLIPGKPYSKGKLTKELELMLTELCQNLSDYFKTLIGDESITASIRLAVEDNKTGLIVYKTFARSAGLNPNRRGTSEAIPVNQGIPRFLRDDNNGQGVIFYHDLKGAAAIGAYKITENDRRYPDDIATMMVAPLNAWSGTRQDMIGLLYIASRQTDVFEVSHVDSIAFVADHAATAIANVVELVRLKCNTASPLGGHTHA
ncbi:MAG: hypothetical protein IPK02_01365 [Candidatus Accumulibacter sp.]|uniref:GAF domain-containing protein n=1 Tax=Candidatus Accumulibacter affinis TaxID=2954384 RepID=A0A935W1X6_9PROT|nr:hypothetical protein [Candidatus Accumulibacter affinis]